MSSNLTVPVFVRNAGQSYSLTEGNQSVFFLFTIVIIIIFLMLVC